MKFVRDRRCFAVDVDEPNDPLPAIGLVFVTDDVEPPELIFV